MRRYADEGRIVNARRFGLTSAAKTATVSSTGVKSSAIHPDACAAERGACVWRERGDGKERERGWRSVLLAVQRQAKNRRRRTDRGRGHTEDEARVYQRCWDLRRDGLEGSISARLAHVTVKVGLNPRAAHHSAVGY